MSHCGRFKLMMVHAVKHVVFLLHICSPTRLVGRLGGPHATSLVRRCSAFWGAADAVISVRHTEKLDSPIWIRTMVTNRNQSVSNNDFGDMPERLHQMSVVQPAQ
jgi:hypothetical protein